MISLKLTASPRFIHLICWAVLILADLVVSRPARAIDCAKASTQIEVAICSDGALRKKDAELAASYFRLLRDRSNVPTASERDGLLAGQRGWIAGREKRCGALDAAKLRQCVSSSMDERIEALKEARTQRAKDKQSIRNMEFSVGRATLKVASTGFGACGSYALIYNNKLISCGSDSLYLDPAFEVRQRLKHGEDEAVLLESHDGGQMNCSHYYILVFEDHRGFRSDEFGESCFVPGREGEASRVGEGFQFRRDAEPAKPGEQLDWNWETGITRTTIAYEPRAGVAMNELMAAPTANAPLGNQEFYRAVLKIPESDRQDFLVSLQGVDAPCECQSPIDFKVYGVRRTKEVYSASACGLYLEGYVIQCNGPDILAVWEKSSGKFYFATVHGGNRGEPFAEIRVFPPYQSWPAAARTQYDDWIKTAPW